MYKGDTMREEKLKDIREKLQLYPKVTISLIFITVTLSSVKSNIFNIPVA